MTNILASKPPITQARGMNLHSPSKALAMARLWPPAAIMVPASVVTLANAATSKSKVAPLLPQAANMVPA